MRVFISWSGPLGKGIAGAFNEWLPHVLQAVKPYFSQDMPKGKHWAFQLADVLRDCRVGIIVVTPDSLCSPWINFEAGALSKEFTESRVCTVLFDISPSDLVGPLAQFQACRFEKDEFRQVVASINSALGENSLSESQLSRVYRKWWPDLRERVEPILEARASREVADAAPANPLLTELGEIKKQNLQLAAALAELRTALFASRVPGIANETAELVGTWYDCSFGGMTRFAALSGEYLIVAYQGIWPGVWCGTVRDGMYRFSWTRFDETLSGRGYLKVSENHKQLEGGVWFNDTDVESMLARETFIEHHLMVRRSSTIDEQGLKVIENAMDFLRRRRYDPKLSQPKVSRSGPRLRTR